MDAGVKERSGHVKQRRFLIFNPPWHLVVTNLHFTQDGMTTILFVFRWSSPIRFGVWNARLLKTKVLSLCDLMLSRRLDLLSVTEWWLTSNDYHCRPHGFTWRLRCLSLAKIHSQRRWTCVIARKGLHVSRNEGCIFSSFEHSDLTITSGDKVFRLLTVYRPPPSKKNGFTVERFFSEFSTLSEELTVTSC